ncbi:Gfo/Idh/MocA family oxidoreductase [Herbiconiux moechotypicola]|uniref:Gfo/Idh/MocA family oxidoreductase n=1 Tax=Herbiconiux moechotypicola TaxID=637393 RepID=A0ABN3DPH1_9MICO|nr:Gfo/Idh/MocA family oxidoreductase [Herbiconiux moechotypicola]MCS5731662.1 Gfo/Idh/MocA family oxidoreductase [Herbiconiux moechotypicola]
MTRAVRIGIVGLGFGAEFIPIYQAHPGAELVAVCQRSAAQLERVADHFGVHARYTSFEEMLEDPDIDAVHINTPIGFHADQAVAALDAGKHVACTVPMAVSLEDCARVVGAQQRSGKHYMMMETAVYTREFFYAQELVSSGKLGRIQFLRGAHMQEMAGWPDYWRELPPMHYATHAIAPLLALAEAEAESVRCIGSGMVRRDDGSGGPPFAVQSALFALRDSDLAMEVTRSLYDVAREYVESFDVYGSLMSYEWQQLEREAPVVFRGEEGERVSIPDYADRLPDEIRAFTTRGVYDTAENQHLSFTQGSGHGGSHPHLAHEFVSAILEDRAPFPDAFTAANWTAAGIAAHHSAVSDLEVAVPNFRGVLHV